MTAEAGSRWLLGRSLQALATLCVVLVLLFFLMRLVPGDPLSSLEGERNLSINEIAHLRRMYGLDQPVTRQFSGWIAGVARGDLGISISQKLPVTEILKSRLPASLLLGGTVLLLNFTLGIGLGVYQARRRGSAADRWLSTLSLSAYAAPSFWVGLGLAYVFSIWLRWLPAGGMHDPLASDPSIGDTARHLILPVVTLSLVSVAATMRQQRSAMIQALRLDFVRTARAKGLPERAVLRHAWRNALFPVLTLFGLWLPLLVTGSVFVESVFTWPGLGLLAQQAIASRDYPLLMGVAILVSAAIIGGGLLTDIAYAFLDPRVRYA